MSGYYVIINELASMDLQTWFKNTYSPQVYESIFMQIIFAISAFHQMGYLHHDLHLGNFLVHKVTPGGYWRYRSKRLKKDIFVPNTGYLLVIWDPGMTTPYDHRWAMDYLRPFILIRDIYKLPMYQALRLQVASKTQLIQADELGKLFAYGSKLNNENQLMDLIINGYVNMRFKHIHIGGVPPGHLLNIKPYFVG